MFHIDGPGLSTCRFLCYVSRASHILKLYLGSLQGLNCHVSCAIISNFYVSPLTLELQFVGFIKRSMKPSVDLIPKNVFPFKTTPFVM